MRKITVLFLAASLFPPLPATAKKVSTTRNRLKASTTISVPTSRDSAVAIDSGKMLLRGYDKPLRSRKESLFVTNNLGDSVSRIHLKINYTDMRGRQLHSSTLWIDADIPPGQTRQISFPSWDTQQSFYYHLSRPPRAEGAPYRVTARVDSVAVIR